MLRPHIMSRIFLLVLILFPGVTFADLKIDHTWIQNLPPTVPVRAGYMSISNTGSEAVSILSVSSDAFSNVEVHQTIMQDGMMHMEQVPALTIEPNSQLDLKPGGIHLMLMQPLEPTRPGDKIRITFELSDGSQQSPVFTVRK
jgi:copper(I)-binding protein